MINPTNLKEYPGEEEWENFQPTDVLSPDISGKLWNNINKTTGAAHTSYIKWMAIAASILLVVGLSWQFILKNQKTGIISAANAPIAQNIANNTPPKKALTLSDGSTIELFANSTISYPKDFNSVKRDVLLSGEANFDIAADVAKPFCVSINSVLITVLGTRFTANSYDANTITKVILYEGRVKVKIIDPFFRDKNEFYLTPGDIFIYKKKGADSLSARILHLEKDKDNCFVFNNYPLDVVFDQLQIIYNTKIVYDKAELGNRSFIGKIDKKDPLLQTLKSITLLNNLGLHKEGDSFEISSHSTPY